MQSLLWWKIMFRDLMIDKYIIFHSCKRLRLCFCDVRHFVYFSDAKDLKQDKVQTYIELSEMSVWVSFLTSSQLLFWRSSNFNSDFLCFNYRFSFSSFDSLRASTNFARWRHIDLTRDWVDDVMHTCFILELSIKLMWVDEESKHVVRHYMSWNTMSWIAVCLESLYAWRHVS